MSLAEELPVICAMEEFAKPYPFLAVYSDKNFAPFRNCRGPDTRSWMSNEANKNKTTIAIYIQSPNRLDSRGLEAQVTGDQGCIQVECGCRDNAVRHIGHGSAGDLPGHFSNCDINGSNN